MVLNPGLSSISRAIHISWKGSSRENLNFRKLTSSEDTDSGELLKKLKERSVNRGIDHVLEN